MKAVTSTTLFIINCYKGYILSFTARLFTQMFLKHNSILRQLCYNEVFKDKKGNINGKTAI